MEVYSNLPPSSEVKCRRGPRLPLWQEITAEMSEGLNGGVAFTVNG